MPSRQPQKSSPRVRSSKVTHVSLAKKQSSGKTSLSKKTGLKDHGSVVDVIIGQMESSPLRR
ncbi:MAG TPA: hypothetical protein VL069_07730, partial [Opitutus sp.]|nr:hypothetical protein [Opitutus sp.]